MVYVEKDMEMLTLLQYRKEEIISFYNRFNSMINEVEECGGTPGYHERMHKNTFDAAHLELHPSIEEADLSPEQRQMSPTLHY